MDHEDKDEDCPHSIFHFSVRSSEWPASSSAQSSFQYSHLQWQVPISFSYQKTSLCLRCSYIYPRRLYFLQLDIFFSLTLCGPWILWTARLQWHQGLGPPNWVWRLPRLGRPGSIYSWIDFSCANVNAFHIHLLIHHQDHSIRYLHCHY